MTQWAIKDFREQGLKSGLATTELRFQASGSAFGGGLFWLAVATFLLSWRDGPAMKAPDTRARGLSFGCPGT